MLVFAYRRGGAPAAGLVAVLQLVPSALVAPFGAALGDLFRRERLMLGTYVAQALAMTATGAALFLDAPLGLVFALAAVAAMSITFTRPLLAAMLPSMARTPEELTAAYVASGTIESLSLFIGPAVAGGLMTIAGPGAVFAVMAVTLAASATLVARLRLPTHPGRARVSASTIVRSAVAGFRHVAREPHPRTVMSLMSAFWMQDGAMDVLIVVVAIELLAIGDAGAAFLNSAVGVGGVMGGALAVVLVGRSMLAPPFRVGAVVSGASIAAIAGVPVVAGAAVLLLMGGGGRVFMDVTGRTLLQRVIDDRMLTRIFGILESLYMLALAVGSIVASVLVRAAGTRLALVAAGACVPAVTLLAWRPLSAVDRVAPQIADQVRLLRSIAMFAALPPVTLERLARRLTPLDADGGAVIVRQGEPGDRFYVVAGGEVSVSVDGRVMRTEGPGGFFGEIALLREVPRTATVTATAPTALFALERDDFLAAVTGHAPSARLAEDTVRQRLRSSRS
jgi:MFS family permease